MENKHSANKSLEKSSLQLFLSSSMNTTVANTAQEVMNYLFTLVKKNNLVWINPRIIAKSSADIGFEWWEDGKFFALSINPDESIDFVKGYGSTDPSRKWESSTLRNLTRSQDPSKRELLATWKWLIN